MQIVIDIETIPDQDPKAVERIAETLTVKAPSNYNKPDFIRDLKLGDEGKYKNVAELKELWVQELGESKKTEQATEHWLKTSFDGGRGQIICICIKIVDTGECLSFAVSDEVSEKDMLVRFWHDIEVRGKAVFFIAHNAKFDLPFLSKRCVINRVKPPFNFNPHGRNGSDHYCTSESWAGFGQRISLNNLAAILGEGSKTEGMDGSQVWPEYQKGNIDKIVSYCVDDVDLTTKVYKRLAYL